LAEKVPLVIEMFAVFYGTPYMTAKYILVLTCQVSLLADSL